jgi:hypothetical protein
MKQKTNQILFQYWNGVRGERLAPRRFEIEPARISSILPETFILERVDAGMFAYRLAGTKLCEQFGDASRGENFLDDWCADDQAALAACLSGDVGQGGALLAEFEVRPVDGTLSAARVEMLILPLVHTSTTVSRFLGAMSAIDPPTWVGGEPVLTRRLLELDIVWPDGRPHALVDAHRNQTPLLTSMAGARLIKVDRRTFRVLDGGRTETE